MPYVPGCQYDLFISYASENNRNRWVEIFKDALADELEQLLGRQFSKESVFFDKTELRIGQSFPETLATAAEASAVFLPVLSPSYLTSDWCDQERIAFLKRLPEGATPAECIAPISVRPIDDTLLTEHFRNQQRVSFLQSGRSEPWPAQSREWTSVLKRFAEQMKIVLQQLRQKCKPVFLGRALPGQDGVRNVCAMELQKRHFSAGPAELPVLDDEARLTSALQQAVLSVHFIGGANEPALRAIEIAADVCPSATVLYRPYGAKITEDENLWLLEFERGLKPTTTGKYHRLEDKSEQELLLVLEQEITRFQPPLKAAPEAALGLVCDELDLDLARSLRQEIQDREQLSVSYPDFLETNSTAMERKRKWTALLNSARALLFCWGKTQETSRLESLYRLAATAKPADNLEWYLSPPNLSEKQQKFPLAICQANDQLRQELLARFLSRLLARNPATR